MNKIKQIIDAWPVLAAVGLLMVALLTAYAKGFVGDVVKQDLATTPIIIEIDRKIAANTENIDDHDEDVDELKGEIRALGVKIDRLVEIMLSQ